MSQEATRTEPESKPQAAASRLRRLAGPVRRHPFCTLLLVLLLIPATALTAQYLWARHHLNAARAALQQPNFASADAHLRECLRVWPLDAQIHLLLAQSARRAQNYDEAEHCLEICAQLHAPGDALDLERLLLRVQQGQLEGIDYELYQRSEADNAESLLILEALAQGYLSTYHIRGTMSCLERLLERQPNHTRGLFLQAQVMELTTRWDDALALYRRILTLNPDDAEARLGLGDVLVLRLRFQDALEHFNYLRASRPEDPTVRWGLACCLDGVGRYDEARPILDALIAEHPDNARVLGERGRLAFLQGKFSEAADWTRRSLEKNAFDRKVMYTLSQSLERIGQSAEAKKYQQRMDELERLEKEYVAKRKEAMDQKRAPDKRCELGMLCLRLGWQEQGLHWLEGAVQEDPEYVPALIGLVDYYRQAGKPAAAEPYQRRVQELKARRNGNPAKHGLDGNRS